MGEIDAAREARAGMTAVRRPFATTLVDASTLLVGTAVVLLVAAGAAVVYTTGGTRNAWLHVMYLPILLAAFRFGLRGAVPTALLCGLAAGPAMPMDVTAGMAQEPANWLFRTVLFVVVATAAGVGQDLVRARHGALAASESRFRALVRNASDLILVVRGDGTVTYASPSVRSMLGRAPGDLRGCALTDLLHPTDAETPLLPAGGDSLRAEARFQHQDGSWRHLALVATDLRQDASVEGFVLNGFDVTEHRAVEAELRYRALHDPLTGLPNRSLLCQRITEALDRPGGGGPTGRAALLLMNVDRLESVSEAYGYAAGDAVVATLATRLQEHLRDDGLLLARYGDRELAVLVPRVHDDRHEQVLAERLREIARRPFILGGEEIFLTASVGLAVERPGHDVESLIADAYVALRAARRSGGHRSVVFVPDLRGQDSASLKTESALHRALRNSELRAHFQPVVRASDGVVVGFEALVRWLHPARGLVPPLEFIPVAERTGMIRPVGAWMLRRACAWLAAWRRRLPAAEHLWVSLNVSAQQLLDDELPAILEDALRNCALPPDRLTLEITETSFVGDAQRTVAMLERLRATGVRLAVDDFGTGYSSLGVLDEMPVDILKIDRSFVRRLGDEEDDAILSAVIGLARSLDLGTVAEGVETRAQSQSLLALGCPLQQGFLFSRPLPPDRLDLPALLARNQHSDAGLRGP